MTYFWIWWIILFKRAETTINFLCFHKMCVCIFQICAFTIIIINPFAFCCFWNAWLPMQISNVFIWMMNMIKPFNKHRHKNNPGIRITTVLRAQLPSVPMNRANCHIQLSTQLLPQFFVVVVITVSNITFLLLLLHVHCAKLHYQQTEYTTIHKTHSHI